MLIPALIFWEGPVQHLQSRIKLEVFWVSSSLGIISKKLKMMGQFRIVSISFASLIVVKYMLDSSDICFGFSDVSGFTWLSVPNCDYTRLKYVCFG